MNLYNNLIFILVILTFIACKKENESEKTLNPFQNIAEVELQEFQINSDSSIVTGKKGTKIYFYRNDFQIEENQKITIELKEYFSLTELISDKIQTLTVNDELLESNGVIFLTIKADGKPINLKENKFLKIEFPVDLLREERIYNGKINSENGMRWKINEEVKTKIAVIDSSLNRKSGVDNYKEIMIPIDSVEYYKNLDRNRYDQIIDPSDGSSVYKFATIFTKTFGWLNIDKILDPDRRIDFEVSFNNTARINEYHCFILYPGKNSFITFTKNFKDNLFKNIPIKDETYAVFITEIENEIFAEKIKLGNLEKDEIELNLKPTNSSSIINLITQ